MNIIKIKFKSTVLGIVCIYIEIGVAGFVARTVI